MCQHPLKFPSTARVDRKLTKTFLYNKLGVPRVLEKEFAELIEKISVGYSIKEGTVNIAEGKRVKEVLVLDLQLRMHKIPVEVIRFLSLRLKMKTFFRLLINDEVAYSLVYRNSVETTQWIDKEDVDFEYPRGENLDDYWRSLCNYVYGGSAIEQDLEALVSRVHRQKELKQKISVIEKNLAKELQIHRRNEYYRELTQLKVELGQIQTKLEEEDRGV